MKRSLVINRVALRRVFREAAGIWMSGRRNLPPGLIETAESAVHAQIAIFAAAPKAAKNPKKKANTP